MHSTISSFQKGNEGQSDWEDNKFYNSRKKFLDFPLIYSAITILKKSRKKGGRMGFPTKVQMINRKNSRQFYVNSPSACAQMMNLRKGEMVEWEITPEGNLVFKRPERRNGEKDGGK